MTTRVRRLTGAVGASAEVGSTAPDSWTESGVVTLLYSLSGSSSSSTKQQESVSHHDATGMSGGDDYQSRDERLRAEAVDVTSMRDLFAHAGKEAGKELEGKKHSDDLMRLMMLGVQYEAFSRYTMPSEEWVKRRLIGIMRVGSETERGSNSTTSDEPITNPDRGWSTEETKAMNEARVRVRTADEALSSGPAVIIDISIVGVSGGHKSSNGKGSIKWYRLARIPCTSIPSNGVIDSQFFSSLPQGLIADVSSSSPPGSSIKLSVRFFITGGSFEHSNILDQFVQVKEVTITSVELSQLAFALK